MNNDHPKFRCIFHGSFRKHYSEIQRAHAIFAKAGIEVIAPEVSEIKEVKNGFAVLESDRHDDPRLIELLYLHHLKKLGRSGFSYFVNPEGYIGKSASYELGIAQVSNIRLFFSEPLEDHPAYVHQNAVWKPEHLAEYIMEHKRLPEPEIHANEEVIHSLWTQLVVPGSVVSVGGIIEHASTHSQKEVLLVKTHKWGGRYSVVGGKVKRGERLHEALLREIQEETRLSGHVADHICTFDQIENSGYYLPGMQHIFVDKVVRVESKRVVLNDGAEDFVWIEPNEALRFLSIEPNARFTLELYAQNLV